MAISSTLLKKAHKVGIALIQEGNSYMATSTPMDTIIHGSSAKQVLNDMLAIHDSVNYPSFRCELNEDDTFDVYVRDSDIRVTGLRPEAALAKAKAMWQEERADLDISDEEADNEARADIAVQIEEDTGEEEPAGISVVKDTYRAIYKEQGRDGLGSGDWLDHYLANECNSESGKLNVERFEEICTANGVDLSKYKRYGNGWQGRLRMTGRNLLAKVVKEQGHLKLPWEVDGVNSVPVQDGWQGFKRYAKATTLQAEAALEVEAQAQTEESNEQAA